MAQSDLCTVPEVKQLLDVEGSVTRDDPLMQRLVTSTSKVILQYLSRDLALQEYDELYDGLGTPKIMVINRPVTAVTFVSIGTALAGRHALVADRDYVWSRNGVITFMGGGIIPDAPQYVRVTYKAGYAVTPPDIAEKCAKVAALRYKEATRLGQTSKSIGGENVQFDVTDLPKDVKLALQPYQRVVQIDATPYVA